MNIISISVPPYPYHVITGSALYRPGDKHQLRRNLGVFDLIFIEYGTLYLTEDDDEFCLKKNDMLIMGPDRTHFGHKPTPEQTSFYWFHFYTDNYTYTDRITVEKKLRRGTLNVSLARELNIFLPRHMRFLERDGKEILNLLKNVTSVSIDKYKQNMTMMDNHFSESVYGQEVLFKLLRKLQLNQELSDEKNLLAINVMNYIAQNYQQNITLATLAENFNFHPGHLIRCMKKEFDVTPIEALTHVRIDNAKHLLRYSDMSNSEIAANVGYSSESYFNRIFKSHTGFTPRAFMRQSQAD